MLKVLVVAVAFATAGCGITIRTGADPSAISSLTQARLRSALLGAADIGTDFVLSPSTGPGNYDTSCLSSMWTLVDPGAAAPVASTTRQISAQPGYFPDLSQGLAVYSTSRDAADVLSAYERNTDGCDRTQVRNGDSVTDYRVSIDEDRSTLDVDQQLNVAEIGSVKYDGDKAVYPQSVWYTLMRIGPVLVMTAYDDSDTQDYGSVNDLNRAVLARVLAVIDGHPVPPISPLDWTADQQGSDPKA